jgi:hypothetical protein
MKHVILFSLAVFVSYFNSAAQGSLQFNQVKMVTSSETIPSGKVWKIISAPYKNDQIGSAGSYTPSNPGVEFVQSMLINSEVVYIQAIRFYDGSWRNFTGPTCQFPLWLPAGTTVQASTGVRFLSVLEFNVIP